jgi:hypothetical protein
MATPLFVALCAVEITDIVFAVDSVPAALAINWVEIPPMLSVGIIVTASARRCGRASTRAEERYERWRPRLTPALTAPSMAQQRVHDRVTLVGSNPMSRSARSTSVR